MHSILVQWWSNPVLSWWKALRHVWEVVWHRISFCFRWFRWFRFISFSFRFVSFRFVFVDFVSFRFVFVDFVSFRFYFVSHFIGTLQILVYWLQHDLFLTISFQFKKKPVGAPLPHIQFKYHDIIISLSIISTSAIFKPCDQLFRPRITLWGGKSIHIFALNLVFVTHLDITLLPVNTELLRLRE